MEETQKKKILITGARGYIATYVVYSLLKLNDLHGLNIKIYALCRKRKQSEKHFADLMEREDFNLVIQDVCDTVDHKMKADIVIHAASIANVYAQQKKPYETFKANVIGLENIINYCEVCNCEQLLFFSSFLIYGNLNKKVGEDIDHVGYLDFRDYKNVYALSKQMGELMLICKKKSGWETKVNVVRPLNVYGPGEHYFEKKPMTDFLGNFLHSEDIILKSDGQQLRSYLYLSDAVKGIFYILLNGGDEECYNLASEKNIYKIKEMANLFASSNEEIMVRVIGDHENQRKSENDVMLADVKKLKSLGWEESVSLENGISRMIEWAFDSDFFVSEGNE